MRRPAAYTPRPARVEAGALGVPLAVEGRPVEAVREEWLVEDRWWTAAPLRRHYYELVLRGGGNAVAYRDAGLGPPAGTLAGGDRAGGDAAARDGRGRWYLQRA